MLLRGRQTGFTLVEILVALTIGLVITAGAATLFISNKKTYDIAEAVGRLQESGRFAVGSLAADLRMAGHLGCAKPSQVNVTTTDPRLNVADAFEAPISFDTDTGTLTIRYASGANVELAQDMESRSADVVLSGDSTLRIGSQAFIANCTRADVFTVTDAPVHPGSGQQTLSHALNDEDGNPANTSNELSEAYEVGAQTAPRVRSLQVREYRVEPEVATNGAGDSIGALMRNGQTLIRGVEFMALRYGECTDEGEVRYVDWDSVTDPTRLVSVRFGVLLHSRERVLEGPDEQSYSVAGIRVDPPSASNGNPTHAGDARLRRAFSSTVSLRNERAEEC